MRASDSPPSPDLIPCPECDRRVSAEAELCPGCGYRLRGRDRLVTCPECLELVMPDVHPRDSISLYCPLCNSPATNLTERKRFFDTAKGFLATIIGVQIAGGSALGCVAVGFTALVVLIIALMAFAILAVVMGLWAV